EDQHGPALQERLADLVGHGAGSRPFLVRVGIEARHGPELPVGSARAPCPGRAESCPPVSSAIERWTIALAADSPEDMADGTDRPLSTSAAVDRLPAAIAGASARQDRPARSLLEPLLAHALECQERLRQDNAARPLDRRISRALQLMRDQPAER